MAPVTQSEDTATRYAGYGWDVYKIDGHDLHEVLDVFEKAKAATTGKPQFIVAKTLIGKGIPEVCGTNKAHGEAGVKYVEASRKAIGLPDETFFVSPGDPHLFAKHIRKSSRLLMRNGNPHSTRGEMPTGILLRSSMRSFQGRRPICLSVIPKFDPAANIATRKAGSDVLQPLAQAMPLVISGSADLHGSTLNYIKEGGDFNSKNREGRNLHFGIREHAMCGILNGLAYDGIFRPSGATFLIFSDYGRPSIRLASLSKLPVVYIFTHDSVGVGEDGPTHEPVETVAALRAIPGLDVIRPADPEETAGAFAAAFQRTEGPTLLALTRQNLPTLNDIPVELRREGVFKGGYVAKKESCRLGHYLARKRERASARAESRRGARRPARESFQCLASSALNARMPPTKESVLPNAVRRRVSRSRQVFPIRGFDLLVWTERTVSIDRFGMSAPGGKVMEALGMTSAKVVEAAQSRC